MMDNRGIVGQNLYIKDYAAVFKNKIRREYASVERMCLQCATKQQIKPHSYKCVTARKNMYMK